MLLHKDDEEPPAIVESDPEPEEPEEPEPVETPCEKVSLTAWKFHGVAGKGETPRSIIRAAPTVAITLLAACAASRVQETGR